MDDMERNSQDEDVCDGCELQNMCGEGLITQQEMAKIADHVKGIVDRATEKAKEWSARREAERERRALGIGHTV